ncbi:hypothetical protein Lepto7375DRAFT_5523 [Leptolyngbya sp. PCC 7375]|nr:hypothetical protein Lepto7375DRAFT_5523 [Leptolyngbya sp. PCC 7375]
MANDTKKNLQPVLSFDGKDDYVDLGNKPKFKVQRDLTLEVWVYIEKLDSWRGFISCYNDGSKGYSGYGLILVGDYCGLCLENSGSPSTASSQNGSLQVNQWYHIAGTYDGQVIKLYINGAEQASMPVQISQLNYVAENNLRIGIHKDENENKPFQGKITEARLWEVARTPEEIQQTMHQRLTGNESGLVGYWPLNEGSGTTANDKSKNTNPGAIEGGATWQEQELELAPAPAPVTLNSSMGAGETGLQDYGYWYRWKQSLPKQSSNNKPFRRGRIWA